MAEKLMVAETNCETGETIVREMNDKELANHNKVVAELAAIKAEQEKEMQKKTELQASALAKLASLGLTEDEAKAIVGA